MKKSLIVLIALMMTVCCLFAGCQEKEPEAPVVTPKVAVNPEEPAKATKKIDITVSQEKNYKEAVFGRFPADEVEDEALLEKLNALTDTAKDATTGYYTCEDVQYKKEVKIEQDPETKQDVTVTYWFEVKPITWYILDESDGKIMMVAKENVDGRKYNEKREATNWGISTLREWLNGLGDYKTENFYNSAFNADEQSIILTQEITTGKNPKYDTAGGDAVKDRVSILSIEDLAKADQWSESCFLEDEDDGFAARACGNTEYAAFHGAADQVSFVLRSSSWQWLRNMGSQDVDATYISEGGATVLAGYAVSFDKVGVRPMIVLDAEFVNVVGDTTVAE